MPIPNARTGSENMGAWLWRLPQQSANTLHKHIRSEEFYFVLEGIGRLRVDDDTLTMPKCVNFTRHAENSRMIRIQTCVISNKSPWHNQC